MKVLTVIGTRPEAIKMAPVILRLAGQPNVDSRVCITAQHREMLDQVLSHFAISADYDLDVMRAAQGLTYVTSAVTQRLEPILGDFKPDWVLVQGDTTTTFSAALAAFYHRVRVAHVEAGLRTGDMYSPWPEEMNRKLTSQLASLHFPPTPGARSNLLHDGVAERDIEVTGNTVIDALLFTRDRLSRNPARQRLTAAKFPFLDPERRLILVTGHRRENFDGGLARVFGALASLAQRSDVQIVLPVHLNPNVQQPAKAILDKTPNVHLIPPAPYEEFVFLMEKSHFIITDSGGVQEEAPSLGKPVLVTRENTERPEAVDAGTVHLIGTDPTKLTDYACRLLDSPQFYRNMAEATNPYGDGFAAERIVRRLASSTPLIRETQAPKRVAAL